MNQEVLSDLLLSRRLERAEAVASARFVEARARLSPESGASWIEVAGAYAMYDGPDSPITQTFGLGLFEAPGAPAMDRLEAFFRQRGARVHHEVSPLAGKEVLAVLNGRGYRPFEVSSVLFLPLPAPSLPRNPAAAVKVRQVGPGEYPVWAKTGAEGWCEAPELSGVMLELMRVSAARSNSANFLAELDGQPVAAGSLAIHSGVALFSGASTIPAFRQRGAQQALLQARLDYAAQAGCELAMMCAEPGSASQRNAERQGFRIAYTRTKWELPSA